MNTRLQVEHPVTELVTGRDLVADQLRIAAGEPLGFDATPSAPTRPRDRGPALRRGRRGRLPAGDRAGRARCAGRPATGIRVDAGIELGTEIGGRFDPMLAKIVAWGPDRADGARAADGRARRDRRPRRSSRTCGSCAGSSASPSSAPARPGPTRSTGSGRPTTGRARAAIPDDAWATRRGALLATTGDAGRSVGRRLAAQRRARRCALEADGRGPDRSTSDRRGRSRRPTRRVRRASATPSIVDVAGRSVAFRVAPPPDVDAAARAAAATAHAGATGRSRSSRRCRAPSWPSTSRPAPTVAAGDPIVTLEAMKMEHVVVAPIAGRVGEVRRRGRPTR